MATIPRRMILCRTGKAEVTAPTARDDLPSIPVRTPTGISRQSSRINWRTFWRRGLNKTHTDRLVIVAPPVTLGDLRAATSDRVRTKVVGEVAHDLTKIANNEVAEHLKDLLAT